MANEDRINYHISREDAKKRPENEKTNILLDLAFDASERMAKIEKILHGNGEPGLCDVVNDHASKIGSHSDRIVFLSKIVWILLSIIGAAAVGVIFAGVK